MSKGRTPSKWLALCADRHDALKSLLAQSPGDAVIRSEEAGAFLELISAAESFLSAVPEKIRKSHEVYHFISGLNRFCPACRSTFSGREESVPEGTTLPIHG